MELSVVIPVYGCRSALPELHRRLSAALGGISPDYEIILVNDACPQNSWEEIERICAQDRHVVGLRLSRNFGQAHAITAGVDVCRGAWVVVMDCDLQDRPEAIPLLYAKAQEGYDVVFARRVERKDSPVTRFLSRSFYRVYDWLAGSQTDSSTCNFSIASRVVIENYRRLREQNRAYQLFLRWLGFRTAYLDIEGEERFAGKSTYSLSKKLRFAASSIIAQSNKPLALSVNFGFLVSGVSFLYILYLIARHLSGRVVEGWTSIIASVYLMGGLLMAAIGIVGIYIGNIFNETKARPIYVVAEARNAPQGSGLPGAGDKKEEA